MTPKEQAKELVDRFEAVSIMCNTRTLDTEDAVKCALICIDEITVNLYDAYPSKDKPNTFVEYWQEVKNEINKL